MSRAPGRRGPDARESGGGTTGIRIVAAFSG